MVDYLIKEKYFTVKKELSDQEFIKENLQIIKKNQTTTSRKIKQPPQEKSTKLVQKKLKL